MDVPSQENPFIIGEGSEGRPLEPIRDAVGRQLLVSLSCFHSLHRQAVPRRGLSGHRMLVASIACL